MTVVCEARPGEGLRDKIEADLTLICEWLRCHRLALNVSKSKVIFYAYKVVYDWRFPVVIHRGECSRMACECETLERVSNYRYLGVILNETLNWSEHCGEIRARLGRLNYLLYYLSKFVTGYHLLRFFKAIYEPVIRYALPVWGGCPSYLVAPVKVLHNNAARRLVGGAYVHSATAA